MKLVEVLAPDYAATWKARAIRETERHRTEKAYTRYAVRLREESGPLARNFLLTCAITSLARICGVFHDDTLTITFTDFPSYVDWETGERFPVTQIEAWVCRPGFEPLDD